MLRPLLLLLLSLTCAFAQDVRITEFLPVNTTGLLDEDGTPQPWIEVWNPNSVSKVVLTSWALVHEGTAWTFPTGFEIPPGEFVVIFASGKNRKVITSPLHTDFTLKSAGGGPLQLRRADTSIASTFTTYPALAANVSYGRDLADNSQIGAYTNPTPEESNNYTGPGVSGKVLISEPSRGFTGTLSVTLTQANPVASATIRYTINGSAPISTSTAYTGTPIAVTTTSRLRARVFEPGKLPGEIETNGYLLLSGTTTDFNTAAPIVVVSNFGAGTFPDTGDQPSFMWVWEPGVDGRARLSNLPTLASRTVVDRRGSSTLGNPKTNFNLEARKARDEDDRDIELLGMPQGSDWVFHAPYNFDRSLVHNPLMSELSNSINRTAMRSRMAEVFVKTTANNVGLSFTGAASGDYFGLYNVLEKIRRGNDRVEVTKLGMYDNDALGKTGGYIVKIDRIDAGDTGFSAGGQTMAYYYPKEIELKAPQRDPQEQYLTQYFNSFKAALDSANYKDPVVGYAAWIDVPAAIDHHLLNVWSFNVDALRLSGFMTKERNEKLAFGPIWDFDRALSSTDGRDSNPATWRSQTGDLGTDFFNYPWWGRMFNDPDFYQKYIDRWVDLRKAAFSPAAVNALLDSLNQQLTGEGVNRDLVRWAQTKRAWTSPFTGTVYPASQAAEIQRIKDWLQQRANFMDSQWVKPVTLNHTGGTVTPGFEVTMTAAAGSTIYYTLDGTDPRPSGGAAPSAPNVFTYSGPITINSLTRIKARAYNAAWTALIGPNNPPLVSKWSGLSDARYSIDPAATPATLAVTEVNYHPADPTQAELAINPAFDTSDFEFIELKNVGATAVDVAGVKLLLAAEFTINNDIAFTLPPGGFIILSANPDAFHARYGPLPGVNVLGPFQGDLSNSGEAILIEALNGDDIASFTYDDAWHPASDGDGPTMETKSQTPSNYHLATTWKASLRNGGTPGYDYELTISQQPASVALNPGQSVILEVQATGNPAPTFQWRKNGIPIDGQTGTTLSVGPVTNADEGNYDVLVTNIGGSQPSNVAVVSVNDPVAIVTHPQPVTINPGGLAIFNVEVTGTSPTFQWRKGGQPIDGETSSDLGVPAQEANEGNYDVVVTNMLNSVTSNPASLTVNDPVVITTQPEGKTVNPGTSVTFSVAGTGTAPITFQWRKDNQPINGATGSELTFTATEAEQGSYDVVVSNIVGPVTSNPAPLSVNDPVGIGDSPQNQTVNPGAPVTFTVTPTGTGPFTYQWRKGGQPIGGATEVNYVIGGAAETDQGDYDVVVSNAFSSATSAAAALSVNDPVQITQHPQPQTVNPDPAASVTFSVTATGTAPITYQWIKNGDPIAGETAASLTVPATEASEGNYRVTVSNIVGPVNSNVALLVVNDPVVVTDPPDAQTVNPGDAVTFTVAVTGTDPLSYQWRKNGQPIGGATAASYQIGTTAESDEGTYDVVVSNEFSSATSAGAELSVNDPVTITAHPLPQGVASGGAASFSVTATGTGTLTYQWRKNGTPIDGATNASYQIAAVTEADLGNYDVIVSNVVGSTTSNTAALAFVDWTVVAGTYQGLLEGPDLGNPEADPYPGRVTATVVKSGKVTGKLEYLGLKHSFSMKLDANLRGTATIARKNGTPVTFSVHLDSVNNALELTATGGKGDNPLFESSGQALKIPKRPKTAPAARAGRYTLLLAPGTVAPVDLTASGYLTLNIAKTGKATWVGKLADSTVVKGSALLTPDDHLAFHTQLYPHKLPLAGYVGGPIAVTATEVTGDFVWRKPPQGRGAFWPGGLSALLTANGRPYVAPGRDVRVIPLETLELQLEGPVPNGLFEQTLQLSVKNKFTVAPPNTAKVKLTLNRTTGAITGSYFDSTVPATRKLQGVILQSDEIAAGFFPAGTVVGSWSLGATGTP